MSMKRLRTRSGSKSRRNGAITSCGLMPRLTAARWAFPSIAQAGQDEQILFIREDWLEKVGMEPPTTLDELEAVAEAFVTERFGRGPARLDGGIGGLTRSAELVRRSWPGFRRLWRAALVV